jgi:hypothetical protein
MAQAEAMWIRFNSKYPFAVKIAAGKINAVSGEAWSPELKPSGWVEQGGAHDLLARPPHEQTGFLESLKNLGRREYLGEQDYLALPSQPWLDGFNVGKGKIRQFVAMPLGDGYTVEEQLTGDAVHGGLQIIVYPLLARHYTPPQPSPLRGMVFSASAALPESASPRAKSVGMGLAAGGLMKQKIYKDTFGYDKWDQSHSSRCFVHLLNSADYRRVTGKQPPAGTPTAADYTAAGLPWFEIYDEHKAAVMGAGKLGQIDSVAALGVKKGETPLPDNKPLPVAPHIVGHPANAIREGDF